MTILPPEKILFYADGTDYHTACHWEKHIYKHGIKFYYKDGSVKRCPEEERYNWA